MQNPAVIVSRFSPLTHLCVPFIVGIAAHQAVSSPQQRLFIVLIAIIMSCGAYLLPHHKARMMLVALIACFSGAARIAISWVHYESAVNHYTGKAQPVTGTVVAVQARSHQNSVILQLSDQPYTIELTANDTHQFELHDELCFTSLYLEKPTTFHRTPWCRQQPLVGCGYVPSPESYRIIKHKPSWLQQKKIALIEQLKKKLSLRTFIVVSSIFFGYKQHASHELKSIRSTFNCWGISHYLARSGLHLVVCIMLLQLVCALIPLPFFSKQLLIAAIIALYTAFSWISTSFIRALIMFCCYLFCTITLVQQQTIHLVALTAICMLLYNPFYIFALDFQLSTGLTALLALAQDARAYHARAEASAKS